MDRTVKVQLGELGRQLVAAHAVVEAARRVDAGLLRKLRPLIELDQYGRPRLCVPVGGALAAEIALAADRCPSAPGSADPSFGD